MKNPGFPSQVGLKKHIRTSGFGSPLPFLKGAWAAPGVKDGVVKGMRMSWRRVSQPKLPARRYRTLRGGGFAISESRSNRLLLHQIWGCLERQGAAVEGLTSARRWCQPGQDLCLDAFLSLEEGG